MIDHTGVGVSNVAVSAAFYDAALGALGMRRAALMPEGAGTDGVGYGADYPIFWIDKFHPHSTRQHTAFVAPSRAAVDAFHSAALNAGGTDNGAPGARKNQTTPTYYAAFVLDPDGNNIEAVFRGRRRPSTLRRAEAAKAASRPLAATT
jgi:catechol 2,3-dioxygenase-like lactoylglutathione lyase family enzyme